MTINESNLNRFRAMHRESEKYININPIQRGGIVPEKTKRVLDEWINGYSVCDFCEGILDCIKSPPVYEFVHKVLPEFLDVDAVRLTDGARESKFIVMHSISKPEDTVLVDQNAHYTSFVAAERAGLRIEEVPNSGYPEFMIDADRYAEKIDEVKPRLVIVTYPDGNYGNLIDVQEIGKICSEKEIPFLVNCAYSIGRMPISAKKLNADFIVGSGHKSMAASGPIGILGVKEEWEEIIFRKSEKFGNKEVELLGCGPRGLPIISLMTSFPYVVDRVKKWNEEVEKTRYFIKRIENISGIKQLGERPTRHDLNFIESKIFYEISQRHKKGRFFLYNELKKKGIVGIKPGLTKNFKISTYQLKKDEINKVIDAFEEISNL